MVKKNLNKDKDTFKSLVKNKENALKILKRKKLNAAHAKQKQQLKNKAKLLKTE